MSKIIISRTRALKRFKEKLGSPVRDLNSVIVGLSAVGNGIAVKPSDLSVSWDPRDLKRAETDARGFAIRSLMVVAYDALDHYLEDLGIAPSPISNETLKSILRKESQFEDAQSIPSSKNIKDLSVELSKLTSDKVKFRKCLKDFSDQYCGKVKKPSIRTRLNTIYTYCKSLPVSSNRPSIPRQSYFAAIELLLAWRNILVHDPDSDQLGGDAINILLHDKDYLNKSHANIDIQKMIDQFNQRKPPTLKDISTLVSILIRFVKGIDAVLLDDCNLGHFFRECVLEEIVIKPNSLEIIDNISAKNYKERVRKALALAGPHGYIYSTFNVNEKEYKSRELDADDLLFIMNWNGEDIKKDINQSIL